MRYSEFRLKNYLLLHLFSSLLRNPWIFFYQKSYWTQLNRSAKHTSLRLILQWKKLLTNKLDKIHVTVTPNKSPSKPTWKSLKKFVLNDYTFQNCALFFLFGKKNNSKMNFTRHCRKNHNKKHENGKYFKRWKQINGIKISISLTWRIYLRFSHVLLWFLVF